MLCEVLVHADCPELWVAYLSLWCRDVMACLIKEQPLLADTYRALLQ
jgi:hypothetical protein